MGRMTRPSQLPEYEKPPLDEVVLGLQFAPAPSFSSVAHDDVYRLFQEEFPVIDEHNLLEPSYETFGGSNPQPSFQFTVGVPPAGSRLWFVSKDRNHLLQFQRDRFLTNWRRRPAANKYPRFETIARDFRKNAEKLNCHFAEEFNHALEIDQTEVSYINIVPLDVPSDIGRWLRAFALDNMDIETFQASFSEIIENDDGKATGRLIYELQHLHAHERKRHALRLSLSAPRTASREFRQGRV